MRYLKVFENFDPSDIEDEVRSIFMDMIDEGFHFEMNYSHGNRIMTITLYSYLRKYSNINAVIDKLLHLQDYISIHNKKIITIEINKKFVNLPRTKDGNNVQDLNLNSFKKDIILDFENKLIHHLNIIATIP